MQIRPFQRDDGLLMKRIRLRALADAPYAFGPKALDEESAFPDSYWHQLAAEVAGDVTEWKDRCVSFVAFDADEPCGTASTFLCSNVPHRAYFSAAWIDPRYRRRGLGRQLMNKAIDWAIAHQADHLKLWVNNTNPNAARFYQALGFHPTGETRPIDSDSSLHETSYQLPLTPFRARLSDPPSPPNPDAH